MKRCKRNPLNRGTLCKQARRQRLYLDRRIPEVRQEINERDYLIQTLMKAMQAGRALPLDEEYRKRFAQLPEHAVPSADRLLRTIVAERDDSIGELRDLRKLKRDSARCGSCQGRGWRFTNRAGGKWRKQCGRCHGQGHYPARLGF